MANVPLLFFFFALIILLGFATSRIFVATRFPDIPILLAVGLLLGPLNQALLDRGGGSAFLAENVDIHSLREFAPFVSSLALIVILFDAGLKLDFMAFRKSMRPAFAHTLPLFTITVVSLSLVGHFLLGLPALLSVILAVALSNVGQTVSAAIIREIELTPQVRSIYFIEMAIYDLISIPILVGLLEFANVGGADLSILAKGLAKTISISVILGVASGFSWLYVLAKLRDHPNAYMVTLAGLLMLSAVNSFLGGSGPVSVLIFGLIIGNAQAITKALSLNLKTQTDGSRVHGFHDEITFLVRSFFFVFLGLTFSLGVAGEGLVQSRLPVLDSLNNTGALLLLGVAVMFAVIVFARFAVVRFISARGHPERSALAVVYGRGLGTAVLATFPFTVEDYRPDDATLNAYTALFAPWEVVFINVSLLIILLSVLGTSLSVWVQERRIIAAAPSRPAKEGHKE